MAIVPRRDRTQEFLHYAGGARTKMKAVADEPTRVRNTAYRLVYSQSSASETAFAIALHATKTAQQQALNKNNMHQLQHFCVVEQFLLERDLRCKRDSRRAQKLTEIEQRLLQVSKLYETVCEMVERDGRKIEALERNVMRVQLRIDASEAELADAAPRAYRTRKMQFWGQFPLPRSLAAKFRCGVFALVLLNLFLFWQGWL